MAVFLYTQPTLRPPSWSVTETSFDWSTKSKNQQQTVRMWLLMIDASSNIALLLSYYLFNIMHLLSTPEPPGTSTATSRKRPWPGNTSRSQVTASWVDPHTVYPNIRLNLIVWPFVFHFWVSLPRLAKNSIWFHKHNCGGVCVCVCGWRLV